MEKRENALRETLSKNEGEIQRWESYVKENETAVNNLEMFSKRLTVDIMVPIGRKAYMPGRLKHTNEVMVGHYQDYFSECSAHTATEICKKRIENGKAHLEKLEAERDLFQNKLEKPHLEGVLPNSEEREIIEPYDEEKEKIWREEHRRRVKEAKLKEKQERQAELSKENAHNVLIEELRENELLDELNEELAELDMEPSNQDTQEILNKLMSGEVNLPPPKKRVAHDAAAKRDDSIHLKPVEMKTNQSAELIAKDIANSFESKPHYFNNSDVIVDGDESDTSIASDTPEEIRLLEKQAEYLPDSDRVGFFRYQLQIINQKLATFSFTNNKEMEEKIRLFKVREDLEELIEMHAEPATSDIDSQTADLDKEPETKATTETPEPKRRISFALEDQLLEFRKNETVAEMIPVKSTKEEKLQRDIIQLDEPICAEEDEPEDSNKRVDRRKTIQEKVEEDLRSRDLGSANLVDKIIESSVSRTLRIGFKHSSQLPVASSSGGKPEIPGTPADLYRLVCEADVPVSENKDSNSKEADRAKAYVDERSQFSIPVANDQVGIDVQSKSILKNKSAVEREKHIKSSVEKPKASKKPPRKPKEEDELMSAYNQVMGDVYENENPIKAPDPLPEGKFVDVHIPKKRISRFKQMRNENK